MGDDLEAVIFRTFDIPPMPAVATKIMRAAEDHRVSAADLAELIKADPGLVAKTLRIANSALFSPTNPIESLQQAVVALGFKTVKNLAIAASARILNRTPGDIEQALWRHCIGTGVAASCIASKYRRISSDEAFTAGLLHDVGKFILHTHDAERYRKVLELRRERGMTSVGAEFEVFGFDHTAVGAAVLRRWKLPETLAGAVRFHQNISILRAAKQEILALAAIVNLANRITYTLKLGVDIPYLDAGDTQEAAVGILSLKPPDLLGVISDTKELYEEELKVFG
ncbi:MAG TPA: HDOD domain-containing protein [Planctomycetes bacterium]|nr:HDOD domain-containing protein [Planctomycetota bacterium]